MSVVVSMSMNQSSSFEESFPSNVGISFSRAMVIFACMIVCMGSSSNWGFGCGWSVIVRGCSLSVRCINSSIYGGIAGRFQVGKSVLKLPELI